MLSNNISMLISVLGVTFGVLGIMLGVVPYLKKKNVNVDGAIKELDSKGELVQAVADEIKPLLPTQAQIIMNTIEKWAPIAAGKAEQLYHAGDAQKEDRTQIAENVVISTLKEMKVTVDDNKKELIDAAVKNAVNDLGHAPTSEAEKNKQLQDALNKIDTLQNQNLQLQQKLSTIKSTAAVQ